MRNYVINGFLIPVKESEHKTICDFRDNLCRLSIAFGKAIYAGESDSLAQDIWDNEKERDKYLYNLYKKGMQSGKAKRVTDVIKVDNI